MKMGRRINEDDDELQDFAKNAAIKWSMRKSMDKK